MLVVFAKKHPRALLESHASALRAKNSSTSWHAACGFSAAESMASMVSESGCVQLKMARYAYIMLYHVAFTGRSLRNFTWDHLWHTAGPWGWAAMSCCQENGRSMDLGDLGTRRERSAPKRCGRTTTRLSDQRSLAPMDGFDTKFGTKNTSPFGAYIVVHNTHCEDMLLSPRTQLKTCSWFIRVMQRSKGNSTIEKQTVRSTYHMQISYNVGVCDHVYVYINTDI